MVRKFADLRSATDDELITEHDHLAGNTVPGTGYYLSELERREQRRAIEAANILSRRAYWLTVTNTIFAVVAAIAAIIALFM